MPSITLADALALTPESLPVRLLKMDAQGSDLTIVKATPTESLRRVQLIAMELHKATPWCKSVGVLYPDRELCPEAVAHMESIGFRFEGWVVRNAANSGRARSPAAGSSPPRLWKLEGPPDRAKNVMCPQDHGHFCEIQAYFSNTRATVPPPDLEQHPELLFP